MDLLETGILALVQGVTEFLPISSSAHLILVSHLSGWGEGHLEFDIAVHSGTLAAVVFYYRKELFNVNFGYQSHGTVHSFHSPDSNIWLALIVASLPVFIVGVLIKDIVATQLRSVEIIAATTLIFAFALWFADARRHPSATRTISLKEAFIIGLAQIFALIPGTSRAGVTITAALLLGWSRRQSLDFSFLLAIPVIGGASALNIWDLLQSNAVHTDLWYPMTIGFTIAAVFALLTIKLLIHFIEKIGLLPFVIYRIVLGLVLWFLVVN